MTTQGDLLMWARERRDAVLDALDKGNGETFSERARNCILTTLRVYEEATGEQLVNACVKMGIRPAHDRAFGPVFASLSRRKVIEKRGYGPRAKGHGTAGAVIWGLRHG